MSTFLFCAMLVAMGLCVGFLTGVGWGHVDTYKTKLWIPRTCVWRGHGWHQSTCPEHDLTVASCGHCKDSPGVIFSPLFRAERHFICGTCGQWGAAPMEDAIRLGELT